MKADSLTQSSQWYESWPQVGEFSKTVKFSQKRMKTVNEMKNWKTAKKSYVILQVRF